MYRVYRGSPRDIHHDLSMLWSHWLSKLDRNSCSRSGTAPIVILFKQVSILLDISNLLSPIQQPPFWPESSEPVILEPYTHIISKPGKEIRALLRSIQQMALGYPRKHLDVISRVVRMLDSASLMVEDIENGAQLWRGQPMAHRIYVWCSSDDQHCQLRSWHTESWRY